MSESRKNLRLVLGDQLSHSLSALQGTNPETDMVVMFEVMGETTYVNHHKQKIAYFLSAMRHFAGELRQTGIKVHYVKLDDPENTGTLSGEIKAAVARFRPETLILTEPGEFRVLEMMRDWSESLPCSVEIRNDDRFIASLAEFEAWAKDRKQLRLEYFYRELRRKTGILVDTDGNPEGGSWNYDAENRKKLPKGAETPTPPVFETDAVTSDVMTLVEDLFPSNIGALTTFNQPVTRLQALEALDHFVSHNLRSFGDYQDAMKTDNPFLHHSLISAPLNLGLLSPMEVCRRAEDAWHAGDAPLNAVEGFIRQILGWREYVRGLYWMKMPGYAKTNHLNAKRHLPDFYWTAETDMNCLAQSIGQTIDHAYAHHIQRLMITGNFALLIGADPASVNQWYLEVYIDAIEWVQLPNTHGMAIYADGGIMASKPYAASGKYIDKMSDYCAKCRYTVKTMGEEDSCPFNALYWNFMIENEAILSNNPRMGLSFRNLAKMAPDKKKRVITSSQKFLSDLSSGNRV